MIPFTLIFKVDGETRREKIRHYVVPQVGESVLPPGLDTEMTVLKVEHDLRTANEIWVVLN